jgi:hypothetical protein
VRKMVVVIDAQASLRGRWPDRIYSFQVVAASRGFWNCAGSFPSGASFTPRVRRASETDKRSKAATLPSQSRIRSCAGASRSVKYFQLPCSYLKSIRYQCDFSGTIAPPVARIPPSHRSNAWGNFISTARLALPMSCPVISSSM